MRGRVVSWLLGFLCFVAAVAGAGSLVRHVRADAASPWFPDVAPQLSKIVELPPNIPPDSSNVDCEQRSFHISVDELSDQCVFQSPLGELTTSGALVTGPDSTVRLVGEGYSSFFWPAPNATLALSAISSSQDGKYIGVYHGLSLADVDDFYDVTLGPYKEVSRPPDEYIRNKATGHLLPLIVGSIAYSSNGRWMVADLPHVGLVRVDMQTLDTQLFSASLEPTWFTGNDVPPLAISDDGRYVAANTDIFDKGNITVYDLSTCTDQLNVPATQRQYCQYKDIWHGHSPADATSGPGILTAQSDLAYPVHLRFTSDEVITFSARYAITPEKRYKAANYVVTAPGGETHGLGLLGMGDSYISGQGEFAYRQGTDTAINACHLSGLSYPLILGKLSFNSFNSIACSGATTQNVIGVNDKYGGQVKDHITADKRDHSYILANFMSGYLYQQEFASTYRPEAILLSVGGDDIGFADILKRCLANQGGGTCYDTYEDRAELVNSINATYSKLVKTYRGLQEQSGGARLYVVGYPQIVKPDGDCGLNVHLDKAETEFSAQLIDYLDSAVQQAARTAGAFYVDTQHAFDGHRLCEADGGQPAMNGLTAGGDGGVNIGGRTINFIGTESYHPTQYGHRLLAAAIARNTGNLSAPMPQATTYQVPEFNPNLAILTGMPSSGRPLRLVTNDDNMAADFMLRGDTQQVTVNGSEVQLKPGSQYQIVLHSDPVLLATGAVASDGMVAADIAIPAGTAPGYHTLHFYGTNLAGQAVDVTKTVYVAASADDFDGDGVPNSANPCVIVPPSHTDADADGVDDACDSSVVAASSVTAATSSASLSVAARATTGPATLATPASGQPAQVTGTVLAANSKKPSSGQPLTTPAEVPVSLTWKFLGAIILTLSAAAFLLIATFAKQ